MTEVAPEAVGEALRLLRAGELVAIPTETVYGLAADAANPAAVRKIFALKGRPADHPLIVHVSGVDKLDAWARDYPRELVQRLAAAFWPGPLTLILKRRPEVPDAVTGGQDTVGLRVPAHPVTLHLLQAFGGGVAAPSANRFGRISPTRAEHVRAEFGASAPFVLDGGPCDVGIESTILDLSGDQPRILRPGGVSVAQLASVLGAQPQLATPGAGAATPRVSGSLEAHYAPRTPLLMDERDGIAAEASRLAALGSSCVLITRGRALERAGAMRNLVLPAEPQEYARALYAALREADELGGSCILLESPPRDSAWVAVHDRLRRSAVGSGPGGE